MEDRLPRKEILQRLEVEHQRLITSLARLSPEQTTAPDVLGVWSVKDIVAHLVYWNRYPVQELQAAVSGSTFEHPHGSDDELNAQAVASFTGWSYDQIFNAFEYSYAELVTCVENLPNSAFEASSLIEQTLDETVHGTLANNTYEHWPVHEAQIRTWIES